MNANIDGLRRILNQLARPGVDDVCAELPRLCPWLIASDVVAEATRVTSRVVRVRSAPNGDRSVVLKCLEPSLAERSELIIRRWLPSLGLTQIAPALIGTIGNGRGSRVWHVYEDLGDRSLARNLHPDAVAATVELISRLHVRAADAPALSECTERLDNLGIEYFVSNVRDAIVRLESLKASMETGDDGQQSVLDRLLARLRPLLDSLPVRARLIDACGGPYTLLHGDLWTINAIVIPRASGFEARLIDWDRAGVGPVCYDLSTFLYRFPRHRRAPILEQYRDAVGRAGWRLPSDPDLNVLFDTAECARYANRIVWPAMAPFGGYVSAYQDELAQVLGWFDALEPVLPA
jgi:hypothetical protein